MALHQNKWHITEQPAQGATQLRHSPAAQRRGTVFSVQAAGQPVWRHKRRHTCRSAADCSWSESVYACFNLSDDWHMMNSTQVQIMQSNVFMCRCCEATGCTRRQARPDQLRRAEQPLHRAWQPLHCLVSWQWLTTQHASQHALYWSLCFPTLNVHTCIRVPTP